MMMPMAVATSMNGEAMEATRSVRILSRNDMKENKNDYQFFLAFMCMMLFMIAMNQCERNESKENPSHITVLSKQYHRKDVERSVAK